MPEPPVKQADVRRIFYALLSAMFLCAFAITDSGATAPQFSVKTLDGQNFSNSSLEGDVVLLQFWTTWCPYCRQDQPAVDNIQAEFGGQGLVVIAVDDGESEAVVRRYLEESPRSVAIVATGDHILAARFGVHGYPSYVVINRSGNISGTGSGGGGEAYLRALLRTAGMAANSGTAQQQAAAAAPSVTSGPRWTNVPPTTSSVAAKPLPKTVFVFSDGARLEADHYELNATFLRVTAEGQERSIPLSALDVKKTIAANRERGINLKIPTHGNEIFLAF
jgi:cytochrome c biogenesis protein CcmG, thiol:disulfide interchange protein DsbE